MYPQRIADLVVSVYAFPADQWFVNGGDICIGSIQLVYIVVYKWLKDFGSIGSIRNVCPAIEIFLWVVQSPCQIEPCIYPQQVFHFVQQNLFPLFLLDIACPDWIEKKSEYTEENKQVAYGKRHEFWKGGQEMGNHRIYRLCIYFSQYWNELRCPYNRQ